MSVLRVHGRRCGQAQRERSAPHIGGHIDTSQQSPSKLTVISDNQGTPDQLADLRLQLRSAAQAPNTRIAYDKAWRCFERYCEANSIQPLQASPDTLAEFFSTIGTQPSPSSGKLLSIGTITMYRCAINRRYSQAGKDSPAAHDKVKEVFSGLVRLRGGPPRQVRALRENQIMAMLDKCQPTRIGKRDAAILAVGFAAALRRSEICALTMEDIEMVDSDRLIIHIRRSKTDQEGKGQSVAVPNGKTIKPITRLQNWIADAAIESGIIFQTMRRGGSRTGLPLHHSDIPRLVKQYAKRIGLDPKEFSAHSLRAGFVTSAAVHHARLDKIMEVTRHKSPAMVLKYIRDVDVFDDHAGSGFL